MFTVLDCAPVPSRINILFFPGASPETVHAEEFTFWQLLAATSFRNALNGPLPPDHWIAALVFVDPVKVNDIGACAEYVISAVAVPWYRTLSVTVTSNGPLPADEGV